MQSYNRPPLRPLVQLNRVNLPIRIHKVLGVIRHPRLAITLPRLLLALARVARTPIVARPAAAEARIEDLER